MSGECRRKALAVRMPWDSSNELEITWAPEMPFILPVLFPKMVFLKENWGKIGRTMKNPWHVGSSIPPCWIKFCPKFAGPAIQRQTKTWLSCTLFLENPVHQNVFTCSCCENPILTLSVSCSCPLQMTVLSDSANPKPTYFLWGSLDILPRKTNQDHIQTFKVDSQYVCIIYIYIYQYLTVKGIVQ